MIDWTLHRASLLEAGNYIVSNANLKKLPEPDRQAAAAGLAQLKASLAKEGSAQTDDAPATHAFIPTDAPLSLLQSHVEELADQHSTIAPAERPLASQTTRGASGVRALLPVAFSEEDPLWAEVLLVNLGNSLNPKNDFRRPTADPEPYALESNVSVILVSDWGTGETAGRAVADQIGEEIAKARERGASVHVVHLGDVYYAGTRIEARERFLDMWPVGTGDKDVHSWCLNGNHDMYSGGTGIRDEILEDPRFAIQRTSAGDKTTEIHLKNDEWQILGLDTAVLDSRGDYYGLVGEISEQQVDWLQRCVTDRAPATILLSHHQPFKRTVDGFEPSDDLLSMTEPIRPYLNAWFWGHDHTLFIYGSRYNVGYCACVGNGAIPTPVGDAVADPTSGEWEYRGSFEEAGHTWRFSGFAVLDFESESVIVRYINQNGAEVHSGRIPRSSA